MKKSIQIVLTCINITVIALLLVGSACILSLNKTDIVKGHYYLFFRDSWDSGDSSRSDHNSNKNVFVIVDGSSKINQADRILYRQNADNDTSKLTISKVVSVTGKTLSLENGTTIGIFSNAFIGKVVLKNYFLGSVFNFTMNNQALTWVLIGGGFLILSLANIFIFMIISKKKSLINPIIDEEEIELLEVEVAQENTHKDNENIQQDTDKPVPETPIIPKSITIDEEFELEILAITHEFETVEELYNHYNTKEIVGIVEATKNPPPPPISEVTPEVTLEKPPKEIPTEKTGTLDIESLLDEIMNKARDDFFAEQTEQAEDTQLAT